MLEGRTDAMNEQGWIKLHRKMLDNPVVWKDSDHLAVWIYLLLNATHKDMDVLFKNKRITLKPGLLRSAPTSLEVIGISLRHIRVVNLQNTRRYRVVVNGGSLFGLS